MPRRRPNKDSTDRDAARARALRVLARREHSARQLRAKLTSRGVPSAVADEILDDFSARGWLCDARFAEILIRTRTAHGYGRLRIEAELTAAGVDETVARNALESVDCDWTALAQAACRRRFDAPPDGPAAWQKAYRFLAQRGFAPDQIHAALHESPGDDGDA